MPPFTTDRATFSPPPLRWRPRTAVIMAGGVSVVFLVALMAMQAPNYVPRLLYAWQSGGAVQPAATTTASTPAPVTADPTLTIAKLHVSAPVVYATSIKEKDIQIALRSGVVHYASTALPGQPGNVAIFGHSSNDWWQPGEYKQVFVLLDKLTAGDRIELTYQSVRYQYEVTGSTVVAPTAMSVLDPTPVPTLTLVTCTPIGTSLKRLVVTARQVDPAPGTAAAATPPTGPAASPAPESSGLVGSDGAGTSFWNVVVSGFESVFGHH